MTPRPLTTNRPTHKVMVLIAVGLALACAPFSRTTPATQVRTVTVGAQPPVLVPHQSVTQDVNGSIAWIAGKDILRSYNLPANCYVARPIDLMQFMNVVRTIEDFPADDRPAALESPGEAMIPRHRLLLIEDDPGDVFLVTRMLQQETSVHLDLGSAATLGEALQRLEHDDFDAVLLDLGPPDSQGLQTFTVLHDRFPQLPAIVLTGNADADVGSRAVLRGAQDWGGPRMRLRSRPSRAASGLALQR